jgi:hypothetical protein
MDLEKEKLYWSYYGFDTGGISCGITFMDDVNWGVVY